MQRLGAKSAQLQQHQQHPRQQQERPDDAVRQQLQGWYSMQPLPIDGEQPPSCIRTNSQPDTLFHRRDLVPVWTKLGASIGVNEGMVNREEDEELVSNCTIGRRGHSAVISRSNVFPSILQIPRPGRLVQRGRPAYPAMRAVYQAR